MSPERTCYGAALQSRLRFCSGGLGLPAEARQLCSNATRSLGGVGTVPWPCTYALSCRKGLSRTEGLIMLKLRLQGHRSCVVD